MNARFGGLLPDSDWDPPRRAVSAIQRLEFTITRKPADSTTRPHDYVTTFPRSPVHSFSRLPTLDLPVDYGAVVCVICLRIAPVVSDLVRQRFVIQLNAQSGFCGEGVVTFRNGKGFFQIAFSE